MTYLNYKCLFDTVSSLSLPTVVVDSESYIEGRFSLIKITVLRFFLIKLIRGSFKVIKKTAIKVIKRIKNGEVKVIKIVVIKSENKIRHKIGTVVNNWISERRENSQIERLFSENNILAWQNQTQS